MVKPNCTITTYHNDLLNEFVDSGKFASRSEALREAISLLDESLGDEPSPVEAEVESVLRDFRSEFQEFREEFKEQQSGGSFRENHTQNPDQNPSIKSIEDSNGNGSTLELADSVYEYLLDEGQATVKEVASVLDESTLQVREALDELLDQDFVSREDTKSQTIYNSK